jgi:hypothetical protein
MKQATPLFVLLLVFFVPTLTQANFNVEPVDSLYLDQLGSAQKSEIVGSIAYLATYSSGLQIYDLSDPATPVLLAVYNPDDFSVVDLDVDGDIIALASRRKGWALLNISNPVSPTLLFMSVDTQDAYKIATQNGLLCIIDASGDMTFFDIAEPTAPLEISTYDAGNRGQDLLLEGDYAFVCMSDSGIGEDELLVLDISDPANPTQLWTYPAERSGQAVSLSGDLLYFASGSSGDYRVEGDLDIFDFSNPASPELLCHLDFNQSIWGVTVDGNTAYLANSENGMVVLDVSNPVNPTFLSHVGTERYTMSISLFGTYAVLAEEYRGFRILDVATPTDPQHVASIDPLDTIYLVLAVENTVYALDSQHGLIILDFSDPLAPVEMSYTFLRSIYGAHMVVDGNLVALAYQEEGFILIDANDPYSPEIAANLQPPGEVINVAMTGDYLFVLTEIPGALRVYDVSVPSDPFEVAAAAIAQPKTMCVKDNYLYLQRGLRDLFVMDISIPASPELVGQISMSQPSSVQMTTSDDLLVVSHGSSGFTFFELTNPAAPEEISRLDPPDYQLTGWIDGDFLFASSNWDGGLQIYDISQPQVPLMAGQYLSSGAAKDATTVGNYVILANFVNLTILDWTEALNWDRPEVFVELEADENLTVHQGESFIYAATVANTGDEPIPYDFWTEAVLPNGNTYGPITLHEDVALPPGIAYSFPYLSETVPAIAPPGMYSFILKAGSYPETALSMDQFPFEVLPGVITDQPALAWTGSGFDQLFRMEGIELSEYSGIADLVAVPPTEFELATAYPNPFNSSTTLTVELPAVADLSVTVFNITGQQVAELANGQFNAGQHNLTFDASNLASGLYFVRATVPGQLDLTQKVVLMK